LLLALEPHRVRAAGVDDPWAAFVLGKGGPCREVNPLNDSVRGLMQCRYVLALRDREALV